MTCIVMLWDEVRAASSICPQYIVTMARPQAEFAWQYNGVRHTVIGAGSQNVQ